MSAVPAMFSVSGGLVAPSLLAALRVPNSRDELARTDGFPGEDGSTPRPRELEDRVRGSFEALAARWDRHGSEIEEMETGRVRELLLLPLLRELGFEPRFQRSLEVDGNRFAISHQGWDSADGPPVLLVADADLDQHHGRARAPHDELQAFLNAAADHRWGLLANAARLRALRDYHHRRTRGYVEFDLRAIFTARSYVDFLALYRLCHATRFRHTDGEQLLERLYERSLDAGVAIGRRLQPRVVAALELVANGVSTPELLAELDQPEPARQFHRELLVLLYRLFFLLFAEQRGLLKSEGVYAESYSVSRLRTLAEGGPQDCEPRRGDLWEGLKVSFRALADDELSAAIGAFPFNGPLFDAGRTPILDASSCENRVLLRAIRTMTTIELESVQQRVNYAEIGVEEIGSVYESLLDYVPVAEAGRIQLRDTSEARSEFGAYYSPPALVDLVLSRSLDLVIEERLEQAGSDPADRERALLSISVIDPACGSAAFLVGAIDRLAERLAAERRGGAPDDRDLGHARRDVLSHCIYAVDKDETAVELAKVALWIHCAVADRPLNFLDHRIQHGDSLVGWPLLGRMPKQIPSAAFEPKGKDSKEAKALRRSWRDRNAALIDPEGEQMELGAEPPPAPDPHLEPPPIGDGPESSTAEVAERAAAYVAYREREDVRRYENAADLWAAAFLWPEDGGEAPSSAEYWAAREGEPLADDLLGTGLGLARELPFFHWSLRFPEIRERGGFDCVVGNPPWEQYKVDEREWFASRAPAIAVLPSAERSRAIEALERSDPALHDAWVRHQVSVERLAEFARSSGRYTPSGSEANTYLMFAELVADLLKPDGRAGVLLKSQLALDKSAQAVFQRLVGEERISELRDIVNGGPTGTNLVFPGVDAKERFSLVALTGGEGEEGEGFDASLMSWNVEEAASRMPRRFTSKILGTLNPRTRSLTSFRDNEQLEVALEIHSRLPTLDFEEDGENPWGLEYATLFHSSGGAKKGLFHRREGLEVEGWRLGDDKLFRRGDELAFPLYEGQLANRYDHRAKTYEGYEGPNKYGRAPGIPETSDDQKADPRFEIEPRYWVQQPVVDARLAARVQDRCMIGFRNVGSPWRNQRTVKAALIPRYGSTHVLPELVVDPSLAFSFLGIFNSTTFDFLVRGHMPTSVIGLVWMLSQVPAPVPRDGPIGPNARVLSLTSRSVADQFDVEPHIWDPDERYRLDVETDALVAREYGLDRQAYEIVLDSFDVMRRMQESEHGYYKFREDCLAAFDELVAATGSASSQPEEASVGSA